MTVKELKGILESCDDESTVVIDGDVAAPWYDITSADEMDDIVILRF